MFMLTLKAPFIAVIFVFPTKDGYFVRLFQVSFNITLVIIRRLGCKRFDTGQLSGKTLVRILQDNRLLEKSGKKTVLSILQEDGHRHG